MPRAMISSLDGDWQEIDLSEAERSVSEGKAYRCTLCDDTQQDVPYDDGLPSFHYIDSEFQEVRA